MTHSPVLILLAASLAGLLAGCAGRHGAGAGGPPDALAPPFARVPFEPISRQAVVAIALREWRLFGQPVDDDPPGSRPPPSPELKPEREPGLWQRVGEYWWLGMDAGSEEGGWTGKTDGQGVVFPAREDGEYAWSAAFVSYVMRIAGAGRRFPYSEAHSTYIDLAKRQRLGQVSGWLVSAEQVTDYAPRLGDLICYSRTSGRVLTYDDLPGGHYPAHCDIVVGVEAGQITVVGGNVDDAVTLKHVPVAPDGKLAGPGGQVIDSRYPWMTVLRVLFPEGAPLA
ncbi:MAG: DUF2272 domain-containing protein [Acetobacteraceae bacterium]|nr:DUF2272 domain-containing protein [Acetobacteraceae bacterium]